ncbi:MAG: ribonuclease BN [Chromatiales bacterium]|nr:ribonuclease BN [Chromatiales bacterium]MDP6150730.1 YhjD/YihY/BrkB family envelope integrity protein [Gammaproteobacteria bacterium]MDP7093414.1 YhjD/YihY/BrkB family envelope integrity protein [Gammaproteobacteria bacterium]MDP7270859.1 YhjD/YihY/BrkB family envelope integrity protein [Gammaproteobacteria bacterium]HJP03883.1 YhjD/YihY/BrkB family envelope integrity protein [Gammaproteobacteria bacterium]
MDELLLKLEALLWHRGIKSLHPSLQILIRFVRFIYAIVRDVVTTTLTLRAMGLVYITILSIVPLLALSFSALKGFGIHRTRIEPALRSLLAPLGEKGIELTDQLISFVDNVQGGLLAGVGLILLIYTTVSMIKKIEDSLNHVWRVDAARSFVQRFGEYLSVVLVGPLLMVTAVGLIATIGSNALVDRLLQIGPFGATAVMIGKMMPYLLVSLMFSLLYWFIPNTRVRVTAALVGGLTGGMLWAACGMLFATFVVTSTRNVTIYASFAIVIIALMWLYISWLILLIGAQTSFYCQNPEYLRTGYRQLNIGNQMREEIALSIMLLVAESFRKGGNPLTTNAIGGRLHIPGMLVGLVRKRLVVAGLLEIGRRGQLIPARDPGNIMLREIVQAVRTVNSEDVFRGGKWPANVSNVLAEMESLVGPTLDNTSLYDLLDEDAASTA